MKTLLVEGDKTFKIDIQDDAKITYGPWSPPKTMKGNAGYEHRDEGSKRGTLRIYQSDGKSILACFAGVTSFRDITAVKYSEMVAREEGASIWKDDEKGYMREDKRAVVKDWVKDPHLLPPPTPKRTRK